MALDNNSRCLTCKKRQIKCDGTFPTCARCRKDNRECRGYKNQLRIIQVDPSKSRALERRTATRTDRLQDLALQMPRTSQIYVEDRDIWTLLDCAKYWNKSIIPTMFPLERPFSRPVLRPDIEWHCLPKVCIHLNILVYRSTQALQLRIDPRSQPDLWYHRGVGLRELHSHLQVASTDPDGVALVAVLTLMISELLMPEGEWIAHLEATQRIIALRGGFLKCVDDLPASRAMLVSYFILDTATGTTCDSTLLPKATAVVDITSVPDVEAYIIVAACACPLVILQAMARTNVLRSNRARSASTAEHIDRTIEEGFEKESAAIISYVDGFDCSAWSARIAHLGQILPLPVGKMTSPAGIIALGSLALCYKEAALLCVHLSCGSTNDEQTMHQVEEATIRLQHEVDRLFGQASFDVDGSLQTQLWKFILWPIVVLTYAIIGWDVGSGELPHVSLDVNIGRLQMIDDARGQRDLLEAAVEMRKIQARKAASGSSKWTWDAGFPERCRFAM